MLDAVIQFFSGVIGAAITGLVVVYASKQTRKQNEIAQLLTTLQNDNRDLRDENDRLRNRLSDCEGTDPRSRRRSTREP